MNGEVDHRPDLRLGAGLAAAIAASTAAPVLWSWSVRDRLPDPMARHWGDAQAPPGR